MMKQVAANTSDYPSLLGRTTFLVVAVIAGVFLLHAVYVYGTARAEITAGIEQDVHETLERLSRSIAPFIEAYSVHEYESLIATEMALKQHFAVELEDYEMGRILGQPYYLYGQLRHQNGQYSLFQERTQPVQHELAQAIYQASAPIVGGNEEVLGTIRIYATDDLLVAKLERVVLEELLTVLALALTLSALLGTVLHRSVFRSIVAIDDALRNKDAEGIPLQPVPPFQYRELAVLSDGINTMLDSIKASREQLKLERSRLENIISGTRSGTWAWNVQTGETVYNKRWAEIAGYTLDELKPISIDTWMNLAHPDDLQRSADLLERHFRGELAYYECEARMRHKDGHWVWILDRGQVQSWDDQGQPLLMYGTHQDITERKRAEASLSMAAGVFRHAREGIVLTSAQGRILDVNAAFSALTGYAREDVLEQYYEDILASDQYSRDFRHQVLASLDAKGVWSGEYWIRCQNGSLLPSLMTIAAVRSREGEVEHYVTLFADISHLKQTEEQLRHIAHYDPLTGLPNRLLLGERLQHAVASTRRHGDVLAVVFLDLDGFKAVNDTYGHATGDELLVTLARRMKGILRECDTVARLGGDEFVVLLPELSSGPDCKTILSRLLSALSEPAELLERTVQVSASLGVSFYPQVPDIDAEVLLRQADIAMYQAKQRGKNQVRFFNGLDHTDDAMAVPTGDQE